MMRRRWIFLAGMMAGWAIDAAIARDFLQCALCAGGCWCAWTWEE